jgi:two-component system, OmpR family, sensor histidine kinase KdpD
MEKPGKIKSFGSILRYPVLTSSVRQYLFAFFVVVTSSVVCYYFTDIIGYRSVSFILFFVVSILAIFLGIGPVVLASALSALIWDFFFIPPKFTIHINDAEDALMFGMFFIIALVNGILTSRVRRQEKLTRDREERTNALYQLTKGLANSGNLNGLIETVIKSMKVSFGLDITIILQDGNNKLLKYGKDPSKKKLPKEEYAVAEWVFENSKKAGKNTSSFPNLDYTFYPLKGNSVKPGVIAVKHPGPFPGNKDILWDTFITQISSAVEREFLNDLARKARFLDESDKLYKTLFNSISHELRIPVATIMSASESLLATNHSDEIRQELSSEILKASNRLNRLIENLLNMSRLESGRISPRLDWYDAHDLINEVTNHLREELKLFNLHVSIPGDMPLVKIDFGLIEQVLYNLVYNATQYASISTNLRINVLYENGAMTIEVLDRGPGLPAEEIPLVFNKFYRVEGSKTGGTGLGLSIAKGFTEAHKGTIAAENRKNGGAKFTVKIPAEKSEME